MPKFILYAYISLVNAERKIIEKEREKLQQEETVPGKEFRTLFYFYIIYAYNTYILYNLYIISIGNNKPAIIRVVLEYF